MKNLKKLSRVELKTVNGGFSCYCGVKYLGEYVTFEGCTAACYIMSAGT
ncbi:hypothetical protein SAMN05421796_101780 [Chryseobacterium piscicola]|uniref:Bacteriocin n=1 Tax=Chryseobacterium piscicola TaxID=551459 RepID=A0A1N7KS20_9FLAO|nr:hypothetical protein SAMN05421796_101780 [Chryseobacterium piscicola]